MLKRVNTHAHTKTQKHIQCSLSLARSNLCFHHHEATPLRTPCLRQMPHAHHPTASLIHSHHIHKIPTPPSYHSRVLPYSADNVLLPDRISSSYYVYVRRTLIELCFKTFHLCFIHSHSHHHHHHRDQVHYYNA